MTIFRLVVGLALPIFVVACDNRTPAPEGRQIDEKASVEPAAAIYSAAGKLTAIAGLKVGDQVSFEFRKAGRGYVLTSISGDS